jgi:predicted Zn finger-like uncharacterized protein
MYVACPSCKAVYQIQAEHLHAARGQVRCGACRNTFSAFDAVFDDPAQALAYAEKQRAESDIEALVSKALEQVPGGDARPEQQQPEASTAEQQPAAGVWSERQPAHPESVPKGAQEDKAWPPEQLAAEVEQQSPEPVSVPKGTQEDKAWPREQPAAGAEQQSPEPVSVPKGTQDDAVWSPEPPQAEAIASVEEQPAGEPGAESLQPEAAYVPKDTQDDAARPPSAEAVSGGIAGVDDTGSEPQAEEPAAQQAATEARGAPGARSAGEAAAAVAPVALPFRADIDFQAQPLAAEFVPRSPEPAEPESSVSTVLLLEHEYHDGISHRAWGAIAASLLLMALLVGQYGYAERYRLAAVPELRPVLEFGCQLLGCDLPLRHDVGRVEILEREVRDHPQVDDALLIHVTFANQADFVQPYPVFAVSFSDVSGTPVAARRFRPDEYLSDTRNPAAGMQPGERAQLMLEVVDPGSNAVSFQFDFL